MVTDEMVEKAAVAMCLKGGFDPYEAMPNDGPRWKYYVDGARDALEAVLSAEAPPIRLPTALSLMIEKGVDPEQNGYCRVIDVEKLLCAKLGKEWSATGMSIVSLVDELSALSAQVQDVAGWQPIETAPRDGTPVILWTVWVGDEISPDPFSEVQIGYWDHGNDLPESHDFSRRPEWVVQRIGEPTHWMPLPAAPAKQEG